MTWVYIWLGVVVVTLVVEFVTFDLVSVWLSIGALVALILAACKVSYEIQIIVAVVISLVLILSLRKVALKWLTKSKEKTNMELIIGKKVKLLSNITEDQTGTVKINGITYSAKSSNDEQINEGEYVIVEKIEGNKLIVKKGE